MATYNKFQPWVDYMVEAVNLATDQLVVALTAAASAPVAGNGLIGDLTQVAYTFLSSRNLTTSSSTQTTGTYSLVVADLVLTASGGAVATFRYVVTYDVTVALNPLICWHDYGGNVTLADGETFTYDAGSSLFTIS